MRRRAALPLALLLLALLLGPPARASDVPAARARPVGHPRARFPLAVAVTGAPEPRFGADVWAAVTEWNGVLTEAFGVPAFRWAGPREPAQVEIAFVRELPRGVMGHANLDADARGVLLLPVRVVLGSPAARGETPPERLLYQIALHELGHALGLPHANDPRSVMCCDVQGLDFGDPAVRAAYLQARRQPDLRSVLPQLTAHYRALWARWGP